MSKKRHPIQISNMEFYCQLSEEEHKKCKNFCIVHGQFCYRLYVKRKEIHPDWIFGDPHEPSISTRRQL